MKNLFWGGRSYARPTFNLSEGRALRAPNLLFSQGLVELAPPK
jgi:hypothetical protein